MIYSKNRIGIAELKFENFGEGGFNWEVDFGLEEPASDDGALIQEIAVTFSYVSEEDVPQDIKVKTLDGEIKILKTHKKAPVLHLGAIMDSKGKKQIQKTIHYWEAWPITKGNKIPDSKLKRPFVPCDSYSWKPMQNSAGSMNVKDTIGLYIGKLPDDFQTGGFAQNLKNTAKKPIFWNDMGGFDHSLYATWDTVREPKNPGKVVTSVFNVKNERKEKITTFK